MIKPGGILRGDLSNIIIGRYSVVGENTVIRPSYKRFKDKYVITFYWSIQRICIYSSYRWRLRFHWWQLRCFFSTNRIICTYRQKLCYCTFSVHFDKLIDQSRRCILKDCCKIADNTILAPDTVVPPFTLFSGSPGITTCLTNIWTIISGTYTAELPEAFQEIQTQFCLTNYDLMQLAKS